MEGSKNLVILAQIYAILHVPGARWKRHCRSLGLGKYTVWVYVYRVALIAGGERFQSAGHILHPPVTYGSNYENQGTVVWTLEGFTRHEDREIWWRTEEILEGKKILVWDVLADLGKIVLWRKGVTCEPDVRCSSLAHFSVLLSVVLQ